MMQETHRFYSLLSLRHTGSYQVDAKNTVGEQMQDEHYLAPQFLLKAHVICAASFSLNCGSPQIPIMCSTSHISLWLSLPPFFPRDSSDYSLKTPSFNITAASSLAYHSHCFLSQPAKYSLYRKEYKILVSVYSFCQYKRNGKLRKAFLSSR